MKVALQHPSRAGSLGFTLIEILVVMGLIALLTALTIVSLIRPQTSASLTGSTDQLTGDLRTQQLRAMAGDISTGSTADTYGVHIETNSYTLFKGAVYSAVDANNFVVDLDDTIVLSTTLPSAQVVFTKGAGEVIGYNDATDTITIANTAGGSPKVLSLNRYGVVRVD